MRFSVFALQAAYLLFYGPFFIIGWLQWIERSARPPCGLKSLYFSFFICDECCESLGRRRRQNFYYRFYPTTPGNHCGHMLVRLVAYKAAVSGYKFSLCTKMVHVTVAYEEIWIQRMCPTDDTIWILGGWVKTPFGKRYGQDKWKKNEGRHKNWLIWLIMLAPVTFTFAWHLDCSGFNSEI